MPAATVISRHGFTITPTYLSSATRRTCATVQGWIVTHPKGGDGNPCGWRRSIKDARKGIDSTIADTCATAQSLAASQFCDAYLERLALWFPTCNADAALAIRTQEKREKAKRAAKAAEEHAARERVRDAAPALLAALREIEHAAAFVPVQDNSAANPDAVRLRKALDTARAAIASAGG